MKLATALCLILFLFGMSLAHSKNCATEAKRAQLTGMAGVMGAVFEAAINRTPPEGAPCGSLISVLGKIASRDKKGGRRLEQDKPLNLVEAQANLDKALEDPAIRARVEKMKQEVKDENAQLVYEAAIMDEEGYYSARELLIQQLLQRVK